jgi:acetoin utilization deacetylase AcuC-like enzyme
MVERARRSVGATIQAARTALLGGEGVAANLAGGTHHAFAHKGSGYCVFNDVAVAARLMQAEWHRHHRQLLRVLVDRPGRAPGQRHGRHLSRRPHGVHLVLHGARNFPFRKEPAPGRGPARRLHRRALPAGAGRSALARSGSGTEVAAPGLAFYLAGADPHEGDRLGRLKLSSAGLAERDRRVFTALRERRIPVAV